MQRIYAPWGHTLLSNDRRTLILIDIIVVVLGTGGILLMAGYAVLCDRI